MDQHFHFDQKPTADDEWQVQAGRRFAVIISIGLAAFVALAFVAAGIALVVWAL